jgi:prepilin-type N-terminal cleavage/methylation domain-containing protein
MFDPFRRRLAAGKREGGFTLIELLLVLIILAILVTMAFPTYVGFKSRAQQRTAQANLRAAVPAVETYFADKETYAGMDLASLRLIDASIRNDGTNGVFVVSSSADDYCVRSVHSGFIYYKDGPAAPITTAVCV